MRFPRRGTRVAVLAVALVGLAGLLPVPVPGLSCTAAQAQVVRIEKKKKPTPPKPPAPKPPAPSYATLLVSVDMDCKLYVDDAEQPITIPAYKPTKVPISAGEHILRWNVPSANVTFNGKETVEKPGQQVYEYKVSVDVKRWQDEQLAQQVLQRGYVVRGDLMWTVRDNGSNVDWGEAKAYCEACRVGGYSDWRMPTIDELEGLYDKTQSYNMQGKWTDGSAWSYDVHIAKPFKLTTPWQWSSMLDGSSSAFTFGFVDGKRFSRDLTLRGNYRVLCVRRSGE